MNKLFLAILLTISSYSSAGQLSNLYDSCLALQLAYIQGAEGKTRSHTLLADAGYCRYFIEGVAHTYFLTKQSTLRDNTKIKHCLADVSRMKIVGEFVARYKERREQFDKLGEADYIPTAVILTIIERVACPSSQDVD